LERETNSGPILSHQRRLSGKCFSCILS
jgi:hypothetical protein